MYICVCVAICGSYLNERYMEKKKRANTGAKCNGVELQYLSFRLVFLLLWTNDCPYGMVQRYF